MLSRAAREEPIALNDTVTINDSQRELLLQGLRYVSSALRLDPRDPDPALDADRDQRLEEIRSLVDQLNGRTPATV